MLVPVWSYTYQPCWEKSINTFHIIYNPQSFSNFMIAQTDTFLISYTDWEN